jgi:hypothetical protein
MHPYTMLKEILQDLGAELAYEEPYPDLFGSFVATYSNGGNPIRLVWDGKEGWGFVQQHRSASVWADVTDYLTEGDLEGVPQEHAKIDQFRQAVATLIG